MTHYWPLSVLQSSPLMPTYYAVQLEDAYQHCNVSRGVILACGDVAARTPAIEGSGLVIIYSVDATGPRRLYLGYPTFEHWLRLERGGVQVAGDGELMFVIDGLH